MNDRLTMNVEQYHEMLARLTREAKDAKGRGQTGVIINLSDLEEILTLLSMRPVREMTVQEMRDKLKRIELYGL